MTWKDIDDLARVIRDLIRPMREKLASNILKLESKDIDKLLQKGSIVKKMKQETYGYRGGLDKLLRGEKGTKENIVEYEIQLRSAKQKRQRD